MSKIRSAFESLPLFPALYSARRRNGQINPEELANISLRFPLIRALQVREELVQFLSVVAKLKPRRILEIGTCRGGTLFAMCRVSSPDAVIISVDLAPGRFEGGYGYRWFQIPAFRMFTSRGQKLHLIRDDAHRRRTYECVAEILGGKPLDLLFIDGDHSYDGVKCDFEMYSPLVRNDGMIVFHDIVEHSAKAKCEVSRFWNELKLRHRHSEIVKDWRQQWAGIGILYQDLSTAISDCGPESPQGA